MSFDKDDFHTCNIYHLAQMLVSILLSYEKTLIYTLLFNTMCRNNEYICPQYMRGLNRAGPYSGYTHIVPLATEISGMKDNPE